MFGLFKPAGKIEILPEKMSYSGGESIKGKIKLEMFEPKNAKELTIRLLANQKMRGRDSKGRPTTHTKSVYDFSYKLDGEHEYVGVKEYEFELKVPVTPGLQQVKLPDGALGQIAGMAITYGQMTGNIAGPPEWQIKAVLNVPGGRDASNQIKIQVV